MTQLRFDITTIPAEMRSRPIDHRGFPVPWFVTEKTETGLWNFQVVNPARIREALMYRKCFVSGEKMGKYVAFVIGPMCTINRVSSDAPVKPHIGKWSAEVCPFLSQPLAKRPSDVDTSHVPGVMVTSNPGVCAVWVTKDFSIRRDGLINIGEPFEVHWYTKGRPATAQEASDGFERGADRLRKMAAEEGSQAMAECESMIIDARLCLP